MEEKKTCKDCENCFTCDETKGICSVPLWEDAKFYRNRYVRLNDETCSLYEEKK